MTYEERALEIEEQKRIQKQKVVNEAVDRCTLKRSLRETKARIQAAMGETTIKAGLDAFCYNCKSKIKYSEQAFIDSAPWTQCVNCAVKKN